MERIYKYELSLIEGAQSISLPQDAEIIHFDMQGRGVPCIWARIDPLAVTQQVRQFWILETGFDVKDNLKHIGTTQHGAFVWHLFEEKR